MKHRGVSEVAVIGTPDPESGDAVKAFTVLKTGARVTEQELIDFAATGSRSTRHLILWSSSILYPGIPRERFSNGSFGRGRKKPRNPAGTASASESR
jgi:acyl-CoA synthetase (AMP-forming)/AMP-acid ligase II